MVEVPVANTTLKFTQSHEWVRVEGEEATIGVTDFAQKELGDIVYVELPDVGKTIKAGEEAAVLESTKAAADVYAPITGEVLEANAALEDSPERVNLSPTQDGWLFKLKFSDISELDKLMTEEQYKKLTS